MIALRVKRLLTPRTVETALREASITTKAAMGLTDAARNQGIFLDLSEVEFAEFSTLAQLAVLVEGAVRRGAQVTVALPLKNPRVGELSFAQRFAQDPDPKMRSLVGRVWDRVDRRKKALRFIEHTGFMTAIRVAHVPDANKLVAVLDDYDSGVDMPEKFDDVEGEPVVNQDAIGARESEWALDTHTPEKKPRILPMRWFEPIEGAELLQSQTFAATVLGIQDLGIDEADARGIVGTVLRELVENVAHHAHKATDRGSRAPAALVGAIVLDQSSYRLNLDNFRDSHASFVAWASTTKSPIVRLVVGDSGAGIPAVLGPHFKNESELEIPSIVPQLTATEKILSWSFNRWSTSDKSSAVEKRGTRGLWRVQRFVRSYQGLVSVRSEDALFGWAYQGADEPVPVRDSGLRFTYGTFLDVWLVSRAELRVSAPSRSQLHYSLVRCEASISQGLSRRDASKIVTELAKATPSRPVIAIAILPDTSHWETRPQEFFESVLTMAATLPNHGALALVFTDTSWKNLESALDSAHELWAATHSEELSSDGHFNREPVLVFDCTGAPRWLSGTLNLRSVLAALLNGEPITLADLPRVCKTALPEDVQRLSRDLRDQTDWIISTEDGSFKLRIMPADIIAEVVADLRARLSVAVEEGEPGVSKGLFLTPTLRTVRRWIDVAQLVGRSFSPGWVAFVLARTLEAQYTALKDVSALVKTDAAHMQIIRILQKCLGRDLRVYSLPGGLSSSDYSDHARIPSGARLILFVDVVLSGYTANRILRALEYCGAVPEVLVSLFDARTEYELPSFKGRRLPVISLATVSMASPNVDSDLTVKIDPVLSEPVETPSLSDADLYPIPPPTLLRWCSETPGSLYVAHIERSLRRHFCTYFNAKALLNAHNTSESQIVAAYLTQIKEWVAHRLSAALVDPNKAANLEFWYPGPEDDFAARLTERIVVSLKESELAKWIISKRMIRRAASSGRWAFPPTVKPVSQGTHVMVIDWGSITSTTIHQLIRLAGQANAASIGVVVFVSQMPFDEELALRQMTEVRGLLPTGPNAQTGVNQLQFPFSRERETHDEKTETPAPVRGAPIPVRVAFLSALRLSHYAQPDCPICHTKARYAEDAERAPTRLLRQFASQTSGLLGERERDEVFSSESVDIFGGAIDTADVAIIVALRYELEDALRSTAIREKIRDRFEDLSMAERAAWIRLLATEPNHLTVPPLSFPELRAQIAQEALALLQAPRSEADTALKRQALIVLLASSQSVFIDRFSVLFSAALHETPLIEEVLYGAYRCLDAAGANPGTTTAALRRELAACIDVLKVTTLDLVKHVEYSTTLSSLQRSAEYIQQVSGIGPLAPREAWRSLREHYLKTMDSHCDAIGWIQNILLLFAGPARPGALPDSLRWKDSLEQWQLCGNYLASHVFPYLPALRDLLLGEYFARQVRVDDLNRIRILLDSQLPYATSRVADALAEFLTVPSLFADDVRRHRVRQDLTWWYTFFLRGRSENVSQSVPDALFLQHVRRCPAGLLSSVDDILTAMEARYSFQVTFDGRPSSEIWVFCDQQILKAALAHVLVNALGDKHANERSAYHKLNLSFTLTQTEESVEIRMLNDGTHETHPRGSGVDALSGALTPFGASIKGRTMRGKWTYEALISLIKW